MPTEILIALDLDETLITRNKDRTDYITNDKLVDYLIKLKEIYGDELKIVLTTCNQNLDLIEEVIKCINSQYTQNNDQPALSILECCKKHSQLIDSYHSLKTTNKRPTVNDLITEYNPQEIWLIDDKILRGYFSNKEYTINDKKIWTEISSQINKDELRLSCISGEYYNMPTNDINHEFRPQTFKYTSLSNPELKNGALKKLRFIQAPFLHIQPSCCNNYCLFNCNKETTKSTNSTWDEMTIPKYFPEYRAYTTPQASTGKSKYGAKQALLLQL